jgi:hypothetical protein
MKQQKFSNFGTRILSLLICFTPLFLHGGGLAEKYPGDAGIEKDAAAIFADDFESAGFGKWDERHGTAALVEARPRGGRWCVAIPMNRGKNNGGHLIKWFMPGADRVYARFYVRFSEDYKYDHHFVTLMANEKTNRWSGFGKAGVKPDGSYFTCGMEPWFAWGKNPPPGELNFYSYFIDMEPDRKMNRYWGNSFFPPGPGRGEAAAAATRVIPKLGEWQCWEFMVEANSAPDKADGKQVMWLDGKQVAEFTGIRWRNKSDLLINALWLLHYGFDEGDPTKQFWGTEQTAWFDNVVVAREYIGPVK